MTGTVVAVLALLLTLSTAHAQPPDKSDLGVNVTFGWQGQMPAEKWSPITVSITTEQNTLSGMLVVEFEQDSTNTARYSTPFAATAGVMTQAQVLVAMPELCSRVSLSLQSDAGAVLWSQTFGRALQGVSQPLPTIISSDTSVIGVIGRSSLPEALRDWRGIMASARAADFGRDSKQSRAATFGKHDSEWTGIAGVHADPLTLPTSWMGYDGLTALIAIPDSSRPPNPRAVEAIHRWVASGGRLIIQADQPGDAWRDWMPPGWALSLGDARRGPVPDSVKSALASTVQTVERVSDDPGARPSGTEGPMPAPADSVPQRAIRLDPSSAWTVGLSASPGPGVLVARHMLGFGSITVVGFDPSKTTDLVSTLGAGAAWRSVLESVVGDLLELRARAMKGNFGWSNAPRATQAAVNAGLERVALVPGLGGSVFVLIMACVLVLAAMVGPVDYFVLRRLGALQRSWITAGLWISIATGLAFFGPRILRTEPTRVNRVSVVDCIALPISGASSADLAAVGGPTAFSSGVTGIYAGDAGVVQFTSPEATSWWRGASVQYNGFSAGGGSALVPIAQRAAGGAAGSERAGPLVNLPMSLWTFRTFTDVSVASVSLTGRVRATDKGWSVMISGLPPASRVASAVLRVGTLWVTPDLQTRIHQDGMVPAVSNAPISQRTESPSAPGTLDGGMWSNVFVSANADKLVPVAWAGDAEAQMAYSQNDTIDKRPGVLTSLPGAEGRACGIDALLGTEHWAAVYLEVADWPVETPVSWTFKGEHTRIFRVLAPLEGS